MRYHTFCLALYAAFYTSSAGAEAAEHFNVQSKILVCRRPVAKGHRVVAADLCNAACATLDSVRHAICSPNTDIVVGRISPRLYKKGEAFYLEDFGLPVQLPPNLREVSFLSDAQSKIIAMLYASKDIPPNHVISVDDLALYKTTGAHYQQQAFSEPYIALGRQSKFGMQKGQVLTQGYFPGLDPFAR